MMRQYHRLLQLILHEGYVQGNRTKEQSVTLPYGSVMRFNIQDGFPAITTKKLYFDGIKGEVIGFMRGLENSEDFKALGCNWWDRDANGNSQWLASKHRKGPGDLGRVYGSQWRRWQGDFIGVKAFWEGNSYRVSNEFEYIDQMQLALDLIRNNPTNRRIVMSAWRPDQFDQMALPPCHVIYRFQVDVARGVLHMSMWQRSCDMFLGVPMNIAGCGIMLHLFAAATGLKPGWFTHHLDDTHIYLNAIDAVRLQLSREHYAPPQLRIEGVDDLFGASADELAAIDPSRITLVDYEHHPAIKVEMVTG
jgi:thymidylate synthase